MQQGLFLYTNLMRWVHQMQFMRDMTRICAEVSELIFWCCRYLLPDHAGTCHLRITFSAHNDLNVKFQSHRSRYVLLAEFLLC